MKFTIDTTLKTIELESQEKISEILDKIKAILPDWEKYSIVPRYINNNLWTAPYPVQPYPIITYHTDKPYIPNSPLTTDPIYVISMGNSSTKIN